MVLIILFLLAMPQDRLPADFYGPHHVVNPKYEVVEWKATVTLPSTFKGWFGADVSLRVPFDSHVDTFVAGRWTEKWNGHPLPGAPGCVGTQIGEPQKPFYFEERTPEGVTIRGKRGMVINFFCRTVGTVDTPSEEALKTFEKLKNLPQPKLPPKRRTP